MEFYSRDVQIMRQSQSKMALEYLNTVGVQVTFDELQMVTDIFVECVLRSRDKELKERIKKFDKWILDKKNGQEAS
jgi:hypothetical protein